MTDPRHNPAGKWITARGRQLEPGVKVQWHADPANQQLWQLAEAEGWQQALREWIRTHARELARIRAGHEIGYEQIPSFTGGIVDGRIVVPEAQLRLWRPRVEKEDAA